jgi:molecular chaperone HtpG
VAQLPQGSRRLGRFIAQHIPTDAATKQDHQAHQGKHYHACSRPFAEKKDDFEIFYEQFSKNIKLTIHEDSTNNQKLARLLRFYSTQSSEELSSFEECIKPEQKVIYWIYRETQDALVISPMLEYFQQKRIKVLFLTELINEYFQQPKDDFDQKLFCITKKNCRIAETDKEKTGFGDLKAKIEPICNKIKLILGKDCEKVVTDKEFVATS